MMTPVELTVTILGLLVTPGPTNTLLFLAGTERGLVRALRLIPAEMAGYLAAVLPLMLVGAALMARVPMAQTVITLAAAVWVAVLAVRLFRQPAPGPAEAGVTPRLVFGTTLLNPKALIFGLVLLPGAEALTNVAIFLGLIVLVAAGWAAAGAGAGRGTGTALPLVRRVAAVWLAGVAASLMWWVISA